MSGEGADRENVGVAHLTFTARQRFTMAILAAWIVGVVLLRFHPGLSAFLAAVVLLGSSAAEEGRAFWDALALAKLVRKGIPVAFIGP